jgi:cyclomaltodextrinase / maltogenic alpha-amylase / neopullulanase
MTPDWVPGRTIYQIHALRAADGGGLSRLTGWLDHVAGLGCGAVLLTPIHASSTHGYDTVDAFALDERLGTDADLDRFVDACHAHDLRVLFDGVFNHAGRAFPHPEWLSGRVWEGHDELPTLNHDLPEVLDWATAVGRHWLDRGGDGWRFDVAYSIPRPFLAELTGALKRSHPDAFLFGEMIAGDFAGLVRETSLHSATAYELFKGVWSSLNDANMWELAWALQRHATYAEQFPPVTFVGNHDVTRIATQLRDPRHLELALAVLFTVPGVPCVYYGDELGWTGEKKKGAGGDDAIRPPLPSGVASAEQLDQHRRWIAFRREHPSLTDAPLEVVDKTNSTLAYRVGGIVVRLDTEAATASVENA